MIREGQEDGEFGPADADDLGLLLCSLLDGLMVQITLADTDVPPERARDLCLALAEELDCELRSRGMELKQ